MLTMDHSRELIPAGEIPVIKKASSEFYDPVDKEIGLQPEKNFRVSILNGTFSEFSVSFTLSGRSGGDNEEEEVRSLLTKELLRHVRFVTYVDTYLEIGKSLSPMIEQTKMFIEPGYEEEIFNYINTKREDMSEADEYRWYRHSKEMEINMNKWKTDQVDSEFGQQVFELRSELWRSVSKLSKDKDLSGNTELRRRFQVHEQTHLIDQTRRFDGAINRITKDVIYPITNNLGENAENNSDFDRLVSHYFEISSVMEANAILYEVMGQNYFDESDNYSHLELLIRLASLADLMRYPDKSEEHDQLNLDRLRIETALDRSTTPLSSTGTRSLQHERGILMLMFGDTFDPARLTEGAGLISCLDDEDMTPQKTLDRLTELVNNPKAARQRLIDSRDKLDVALKVSIDGFNAALEEYVEKTADVLTNPNLVGVKNYLSTFQTV